MLGWCMDFGFDCSQGQQLVAVGGQQQPLSSGAGFIEHQRVMLDARPCFHGAWPCAAMCVAGRQHMLWC